MLFQLPECSFYFATTFYGEDKSYAQEMTLQIIYHELDLLFKKTRKNICTDIYVRLFLNCFYYFFRHLSYNGHGDDSIFHCDLSDSSGSAPSRAIIASPQMDA